MLLSFAVGNPTGEARRRAVEAALEALPQEVEVVALQAQPQDAVKRPSSLEGGRPLGAEPAGGTLAWRSLSSHGGPSAFAEAGLARVRRGWIDRPHNRFARGEVRTATTSRVTVVDHKNLG